MVKDIGPMSMCSKWMLGLLLVFLAGGCDQFSVTPTVEVASPVGNPPSPTTLLNTADLDRFLQVVEQLPAGQVPEFSPDDAPDLELGLSADELIAGFRQRFQRLFDPVRQGKIWSSQPEVRRPVEAASWTTTEFAAFVRNVSCAIMLAQLGDRYDVQALSSQCGLQIESLAARMREIDQSPSGKLTENGTKERTQAAIRLGRMVALQEFVETLRSVPPQNVALVQGRMSELAPLLPARRLKDPFGNDPFATSSFETP